MLLFHLFIQGGLLHYKTIRFKYAVAHIISRVQCTVYRGVRVSTTYYHGQVHHRALRPTILRISLYIVYMLYDCNISRKSFEMFEISHSSPDVFCV